jgi:hypothetical protein
MIRLRQGKATIADSIGFLVSYGEKLALSGVQISDDTGTSLMFEDQLALGEEIVPDRKNVQSKWEHHRKTGHN